MEAEKRLLRTFYLLFLMNTNILRVLNLDYIIHDPKILIFKKKVESPIRSNYESMFHASGSHIHFVD